MIFIYFFSLTQSREPEPKIQKPAPAPAKSSGSFWLRLHNTVREHAYHIDINTYIKYHQNTISKFTRFQPFSHVLALAVVRPHS
jgi:hypothetical protein